MEPFQKKQQHKKHELSSTDNDVKMLELGHPKK